MSCDLQKVEKLTNDYEINVHDFIERKFKKEKLKAGIHEKNADVFSPQGGISFQKKLLMKADKIDIEKIFEIKSDK